MTRQPREEEQGPGRGEQWLRELLARRGTDTGAGPVHEALMRSARAAGLIAADDDEDADTDLQGEED